MAKKILIEFLDEPITTGVGWLFDISVNGQYIYFNSGFRDCEIAFLPNGTPLVDLDFNEIAVGTTLQETLQITLEHLRTNFANASLSYSLIGNVIEIYINANAIITIDASINANISITQEVVGIEFQGLKYFINYEDYYLSITQKGYLGFSNEIYGQIEINKGSVENILDPIRGTGLNLALEANSALTFDEFALADEMTYFVQLKKGVKILFNGFIKPDGIQQSWVNTDWLVNIEVIDGLGAMKDLSFVQLNGTHFTGKISIFDIIKGCLDKTGSLMTINTSVNIAWDSYVGSNMLKDTYLNAARYYKKDGETVMDCNEVLTSILNIFSAVVTQEDGQWWIYRPNDLALNQNTSFINQTTNIIFTKNFSANLGSQIDNYFPHHSDSNQQIEMKGAISAYRLKYEYGFIDGFIKNKDLVHDNNMLFSEWTLNGSLPTGILINDPLDLNGINLNSIDVGDTVIDVLTSNSYPCEEGAILKLNVRVKALRGGQKFYFRIKRSDGKYSDNKGQWTMTPSLIENRVGDRGVRDSSNDFVFTTKEVDSTCTFKVVICTPKASFTALHGASIDSVCEINYIDITDATQTQSGIVGAFYTVSRKNPPSSITKENQTVYNGDSTSLLIGSIYKSDQTTLTETWSRVNKFDGKPILLISAEDDLRIQSSPVKVFSGGIYGYIPYLSVININNVLGLFMFTEYNYNIMSKKINAKMTQFYNTDLGDIDYNISPDFGNTVKPTIKG